MSAHEHWELDSECPQCGKINHVKCPVGEKVVLVHCEHCSHAYDYLHVIQEHEIVEDGDDAP